MRQTLPSVTIGIGSTPSSDTSLILTTDDRLILMHQETTTHTEIFMGLSSQLRIDFLIECLKRLRLHAKEE